MDPVSLTLGGLNLAGSLFGSHRDRKRMKRLKAEIERRRLALIQSKNLAQSRIAEGTAAAKRPLEAIAERVRTEEEFRDPALEQALIAGARQQVGAQLRQAEAAQTSNSSGIPQQQILMAAVLSQSLLASESRRMARRTEATQALGGIYSKLAEITQAGAHSAANLEGQFASAINSLPMPDETDTASAALGGFLSFLGTDTGRSGLEQLFSAFRGPGGGAAFDPNNPLGLPFSLGGNAFDNFGNEISLAD